jgi:hypothetical protein
MGSCGGCWWKPWLKWRISPWNMGSVKIRNHRWLNHNARFHHQKWEVCNPKYYDKWRLKHQKLVFNLVETSWNVRFLALGLPHYQKWGSYHQKGWSRSQHGFTILKWWYVWPIHANKYSIKYLLQPKYIDPALNQGFVWGYPMLKV